MTERLPLNDLAAQVRTAWRLAQNLCACEARYHALWGVLRQAEMVGGIRVDRDLLAPVLTRLAKPHAAILIGGAADAGLLELAVSSIDARPIAITMMDRCPVPLRLGERITLPAGVELHSRQDDLLNLADTATYDIALAHSVLPFMARKERVDVLKRLRRALKSDGYLLLTTRSSSRSPAELTDTLNRSWRDEAAGKIARHPELLALCGDELWALLDEWAATRAKRSAPFRDAAEIVATLDAGGFAVSEHIEGKESSRSSASGEVMTKRSHIFVARPRH